jgi:hypothetical protein
MLFTASIGPFTTLFTATTGTFTTCLTTLAGLVKAENFFKGSTTFVTGGERDLFLTGIFIYCKPGQVMTKMWHWFCCWYACCESPVSGLKSHQRGTQIVSYDYGTDSMNI